VYYGAEKLVLPVMVTTYHSAGDLIALHGNEFKLLIFDEVHHLPAPSWGETALMSPSPFRLGLTATYPDPEEMGDGRWRIEELIGPIVYQKRVSDLVGQRLAEYRTERIRIDLTDDERAQYEADFAIYAGFFRARRLRETHGAGWLRELTRLSAFEREARAALLARHRILQLLACCEGKLSALEKLLRENIHEQILVFTESNDTVYEISRRDLIPALTHETKAAERKRLLEAFRQRDYHAIVTSKVLNEGVDVPEAKIAIVLGGTSSAREYIQRLGRVLRKTGSREAVLYEVIARDTVDAGRAQRRRPKAGTL
jgi:superfamily II DNA or RNA helicase